jgi:nucleoside-triphosphatase THEP1
MKRMKDYMDAPVDHSNFFEYYRMNPVHEAIYLDRMRNDPVFDASVVSANDDFKKSVVYSILHNANSIFLVSGQPGSGKSLIGLALMEYIKKIRFEVMSKKANEILAKIKKLKKNFGKYKHKQSEIKLFRRQLTALRSKRAKFVKKSHCNFHLAFDGAQLADTIHNKMDDNDIVLCDEFSTLIGTGSQTEIAKLSNLTSTMRSTGKSIVLATPKKVWLSGMTAKFVPCGQREFYWTNGENPLDRRSRCFWRSTPVEATSDREEHQHGYIILDIGKITYLEKFYEIEKARNYRELEAMGGGVGAGSDMKNQANKALAQKLFAWAKKRFGYPQTPDKPNKAVLKVYLRESGIGDGKSLTELDDVIEYTYRIAKFGNTEGNVTPPSPQEVIPAPIVKPKITSPPVDLSKDFEVDLDAVLKTILRTSKKPNIKRNVKIFLKVADHGQSYRDIIKATTKSGEKLYPTLNTPRSVQLCVNQIKAHINMLVGNSYELHYMAQLEQSHKYSRILHEGGTGKPDLIAYKKDRPTFISVKCLSFGENTLTLKFQEHSAEIRAARKHFKRTGFCPRVMIHIYNRHLKAVYTREIPKNVIECDAPYNRPHSHHTIKIGEYDQ